MNPAPSKYSMYHVYLLKIGRAYSQLKTELQLVLRSMPYGKRRLNRKKVRDEDKSSGL
jgi:hypothetical protein